MWNPEKPKRIAATALTVAAIGGLTAETWLTKPDKAPIEAPQPARPESIFQVETQSIGKRILERVASEGLVLALPNDHDIKNGVHLSLVTGDYTQMYKIQAFMKIIGTDPDPKTTYKITLEKKFPGSDQTEKSITILSPEVGPDALGPAWYGQSQTFSRDNQANPAQVVNSLEGGSGNLDNIQRFANETEFLLGEALRKTTFLPINPSEIDSTDGIPA